tara:strand:+ start:2430 stop:3782 length:1353 start_codon:yes stop_codon:yes gene_type:complete
MSKIKEFIFILLIVFGVAILIYGLAFFNNQITGKVSFELESTYEEGQSLDGDLKLSLREGEFIPASSKIVFETSEQIYEYDLNEFISEDPIKGDFYIEGRDISGTGDGYGVEGEKTSSTVYFTLKLLSKSKSSNSSGDGNNSIQSGEEIIVETEEAEEVSEDIILENETEEAEEVEETFETLEEEKEKKEKAPITGNIISSFFSNTFNLFLKLTGQASLELEKQVNGEVSIDNEFIYELKKGQKAELLSGSVKTNLKELSNNEVDLNIKGNQVIVTTTYSENEHGFGQNYLGDTAKTIFINLSKLNFVAEPGDLKISLTYEDEEIVSMTTSSTEGEVTVINNTEIENITKINLTQVSELTETEREILVSKFGNVSVEITKAEKTSQGIFVRFELRNFWVEHYYDPEISDEKLEEQVENDKNNFLKDLVRKFSKQEVQKEGIEGLVGSYEI